MGKEQIRNEFVVAFEVEIADVEKNYRIHDLRALLQQFHRALVALEQRRKMLRDQRELDHLGHGADGEVWNQARYKARLRSRFDHQSQLRGGFGQGDRGLRRGKLSAVNYVAPADQFG